MKKIIVIGVNTGHDGGAAIVVNGKLKYAISEERLNRKRYSSGYLNSFFYCLNAAKINIGEVTKIVFSSYGKPLPSGYMGELKALGIEPNKFLNVDHHLSHAYSVYFLSPFNDSLVVILDGEGNNNTTESYYIAEGQKLTKIGGNNRRRATARGIGRTYEAFTNFIGWTDQDAGKTMGLAPYGRPSNINSSLYKMHKTKIESNLKEKYELGAVNYQLKEGLDFGSPYSLGKSTSGKRVASFIQEQTEIAVLKLIKELVKKTGKRNLCLAGGVALNSSINAKLIQNKIVDEIFILPAASDRGQPIGNALYGHQVISGHIPKQVLKSDYLGRSYSEKEILQALSRDPFANVAKIIPRKKLLFKKEKNIAKIAAKILADGKILGWFQGGSEFGPRSLGHRSILCDPRNPKMKQILNKRVKHRETFRPFAPSCMLEHMKDYFNFPVPSPFMLYVIPIKKTARKKIPSVTHVDGTGRLQTTTAEDNDIFHNLIKEFYALTTIPVILNTSFNDNEPIVETPADAVSTFLKTDIDYLAIGDYLAWKEDIL